VPDQPIPDDEQPERPPYEPPVAESIEGPDPDSVAPGAPGSA
jgi:hypothetical protein